MTPPAREIDSYTFDDLDPTLDQIAFVVVDLETTGGSAQRDAITEIGAVKVRGGTVLGEFATLVNPGCPIPPQIVMLTSITDAMVADAPPIEAVLPAFLEFASGCVLVAHNARFDISFLKAACLRTDRAWPHPPVIDTVRLARALLPRAEVPSVRLSVLASLLGAAVTPDHRALSDARATVDVLHALIERMSGRGADTLPDLVAAQRAVEPGRREKRHLADHLPPLPGVYLFRGQNDEVLYIGTSGNLRSRVRSYFTAAETRSKMRAMVRLAARVDHIVCATALEAQIREQRLIAAHRPQYNRRSKNPQRRYHLQWDTGRIRQLRVLTGASLRPGPRLGPFSSRERARQVARTLSCLELREHHGAAHSLPDAVHALWEGSSQHLFDLLADRMARRSATGEYAAAARYRDELCAVIDAVDRAQRLDAFTAIGELVVAAPDGDRGWELTVIRRGRLAAAGRARRGIDPMGLAATLISSAETILDADADSPPAGVEESWTLLRHVERPDVRLVHSTDAWCSAARAAGRWRAWASTAAEARDSQRYDL